MAISGSIKLIINENRKNISGLDLLEVFFSNGWNMDVIGNIYYLPIGDVDYDWKIVSSKKVKEVMRIIKEKSLKNEIIGLSISYVKSEIGITILINPKIDEIIFDLDINRRTINNLDITDFSWYLTKIIPIIINSGLSIEVIECIDC